MFFCMNREDGRHDLSHFIYADYPRYNRKTIRKLFEAPSSFLSNANIKLSNEEIIEQCLALIKAMIELNDVQIRESLLFILEEKLLLLASSLN